MSEVQSALPTVKFTSRIPDSARAGGRTGGENVFQRFMIDMPEPTKVKQGVGKNATELDQFAWFFVPADVSDTITDPAEREKSQKANTQKLVNKFTSIARRIKKANSETHDFTFRKVRDPDAPEDGEWGLVVYRIHPGTDKGGPGKAAA